MVGVRVDDLVGLTDTVGLLDGDTVGDAVGSEVMGALVGESDGNVVGDTEGAVEGALVGGQVSPCWVGLREDGDADG